MSILCLAVHHFLIFSLFQKRKNIKTYSRGADLLTQFRPKSKSTQILTIFDQLQFFMTSIHFSNSLIGLVISLVYKPNCPVDMPIGSRDWWAPFGNCPLQSCRTFIISDSFVMNHGKNDDWFFTRKERIKSSIEICLIFWNWLASNLNPKKQKSRNFEKVLWPFCLK